MIIDTNGPYTRVKTLIEVLVTLDGWSLSKEPLRIPGWNS